MLHSNIWLPTFKSSSFELAHRQFDAIRIASGGGEGIRTPDPRVANAVLCQLSYTPDKQSNLKFQI